MTVGLATILGTGARFTARVEKNDSKRGFRGRQAPTVLLADVRDAGGEQVTGHLWFSLGTWAAHLAPGNHISFRGTTQKYLKRYGGHGELPDAPSPEEDIRLTRPTNIQVLAEDAGRHSDWSSNK